MYVESKKMKQMNRHNKTKASPQITENRQVVVRGEQVVERREIGEGD